MEIQKLEVNKSEAVATNGQGGKKTPGRNPRHDRDQEDEEKTAEERGEPASRRDAFVVDGALDGTIPPRVQQMLSDLAGQLEPLRRDLEVSRARERDLRDRLDQHPYLPVLNRQGFEHEFSRVVGHIQGLGSAAFACVSVINAATIRLTQGREAYEKVMSHACMIVEDSIGEMDIVGCLGGHDLGVLMLSSSENAIDEMAARLEATFESQLFSHGRSAIRLQAAIGGVTLKTGFGFSQALAQADADMLRRSDEKNALTTQ